MNLDEIYGQQVLSDKIQTVGLVRKVCFYDSIGSTNAQAKADVENGAESGTLIVADMQTAGRGRRGREWDSPAGKNIYFTLMLKPDLIPDKASMLTLVMALAVVKGIEQAFAGVADGRGTEMSVSHRPEIKWPNDIVMNGKKVCGILTEMGMKQSAISYVAIGVGINVYQQKFASELVDKATSLETECGQRVSRSTLIADIMKAFEEYYAVFEKQGSLAGLCERYNELLVNRNRKVCILDPHGEYRGIATGITDTGELCVELPDGSVTKVYAGEVSVRGIYGYV